MSRQLDHRLVVVIARILISKLVSEFWKYWWLISKIAFFNIFLKKNLCKVKQVFRGVTHQIRNVSIFKLTFIDHRSPIDEVPEESVDKQYVLYTVRHQSKRVSYLWLLGWAIWWFRSSARRPRFFLPILSCELESWVFEPEIHQFHIWGIKPQPWSLVQMTCLGGILIYNNLEIDKISHLRKPSFLIFS